MFMGLFSVGPRRAKALPMETETLRKPCAANYDLLQIPVKSHRPMGCFLEIPRARVKFDCNRFPTSEDSSRRPCIRRGDFMIGSLRPTEGLYCGQAASRECSSVIFRAAREFIGDVSLPSDKRNVLHGRLSTAARLEVTCPPCPTGCMRAAQAKSNRQRLGRACRAVRLRHVGDAWKRVQAQTYLRSIHGGRLRSRRGNLAS